MRMLAFFAALSATSVIGNAHHSPLTVYVMEEVIEVEGVVTDYRFINPHLRIFFDVTNEAGDVEHWIAEGGTPNVLLRNGWSPETFKAGDLIHIAGNPARDRGSLFIHMLNVRHGNGAELFAEDIKDDEAAERRRSRRR